MDIYSYCHRRENRTPAPCTNSGGVAFGGFPTGTVTIMTIRFTFGLLPYMCSNPRRRHRETL